MTSNVMIPEQIPLVGRHLIEASAGTGKTFNITRLVLRFLLESKMDLTSILTLTFTRAATGELRSRIGEELKKAFGVFSTQKADDEFYRNMLDRIHAPSAIVTLRRALLHIDEAPIFTIHGFCNRVLSQNPFSSGIGLTPELVPEATELSLEVIEDWYRQLGLQDPEYYSQVLTNWPEPLSFLQEFKATMGQDDAIDIQPIQPEPAKETPAQKRKRLAANEKVRFLARLGDDLHRLRQELRKRKRAANTIDYDDIIRVLANRLISSAGEALVNHLRSTYSAALIDEFQDTDQLQFEIMDRIFPEQLATPLFMIGDPKQAIFAFRGGDIHAYLAARNTCRHRWNLLTNWRSSREMVNSANRLFRDTENLGPDIAYSQLQASGRQDSSPFSDLHRSEALQIIEFEDSPEHAKARGRGMKKTFLKKIAKWCAKEVEILLAGSAKIAAHQVEQRNIAILVRNKNEAQLVQEALKEQGIPSVYLSEHRNLFQSEEARELARVLTGFINWELDRDLVSALSTRFMGGDARTLAQLKEEEEGWNHYRDIFRKGLEIWQRDGVLALGMDLIRNHFIPDPSQHERSLTNAIQLCEVLQQATLEETLNPATLVEWLIQRIENPQLHKEHELRLESEDSHIRILTMHGAKGLEFPIVFLPFSSWTDQRRSGRGAIRYHHPSTQELRSFLGSDAKISAIVESEESQETMRLFYVGVTRAIHRCYICIAAFQDVQSSPPGSLLHVQSEADMSTIVDICRQKGFGYGFVHHGESHSVSSTAMESPLATSLEEKQGPALMTRDVHPEWHITSFSNLTKGIESPAQHAFPKNLATGHEPTDALRPLRFRIKPGRETGNLLHLTMEHLNFQKPDWNSALEPGRNMYPDLVEEEDINELKSWLNQCLGTPLGQGFRLGDLAQNQVMREVEFFFSLQTIRLSELIDTLARWRGTQMSSIQLIRSQLKGMMHGYIDLAFAHQGTFFVLDYKSNFLGNEFRDYRAERLKEDVQNHFYDLQALIYFVALHRFLQDRMENYNPHKHLGGSYHLYLRGMHPQKATGIYFRPAPVDLLLELDRQMGGRHAAGT